MKQHAKLKNAEERPIDPRIIVAKIYKDLEKRKVVSVPPPALISMPSELMNRAIAPADSDLSLSAKMPISKPRLRPTE